MEGQAPSFGWEFHKEVHHWVGNFGQNFFWVNSLFSYEEDFPPAHMRNLQNMTRWVIVSPSTMTGLTTIFRIFVADLGFQE